MGLSRRSPLAATALLALAIAAIVPSARGFAVEVAFNETECFSKQIENARDPDGSHELPFRVMGAYVVSKDPHKYYEMQRGERSLAMLQVEVTQPDGTIIHRDSEGKSRSEFDVMGAGVGTYSICFTNAGTKGKKAWTFALPHQKIEQQKSAYVRVHYFQPVHADDDDEIDAHLARSPRNTVSADAAVPRKAESVNAGGKKQNAQTGKALSAAHASDINVLVLNLQDEGSLMRQELSYLKRRASRHKKTADSNARRTLWWTAAEVVTLCTVAAVQVLAVRHFFNKDSGAIGKPGGGRPASGPGTMYGGASGGGFGGAGSLGSVGTFANGFGGAAGFGSAAAFPTAGPYGSGTGSQSSGGVLPPTPGQGTGSYAYGGQAQGIGGASVYGNQDGLRGRGGGAF